MASASEVARKHAEAALLEAGGSGISADALARALMHAAIEMFRRERGVEDVAAELAFVADNLDEDETYPFMRP